MTNNQEIIEKINKIIDESIRPALNMDGGDIEFVDFKDGVVQVRLQGACVGCPGAAATLKYGVETMLKEHIKEVESVEAV